MSLISVSNLTFCYEGSYKNIFENVNFQIDTDWKLGLIGRNGSGKTTFLNLIQEKYEYSGSINYSITFDYFPFEIKDKEKNTIEIIEEVYPDYEFWKICRELNLMDVDTDIFYRPYSTLSNGEQTKVMLAMLFSKENNFLLIDEPTNHLDAEARVKIKEYLNHKKGFILVSHDRDFLDGCIDHVLVINKINIEVQQGTFSTWWENKERQDKYEISENERLKKDIKRLKDSAKKAKDWADDAESTKIGKKSLKHEKNIDTRAYIGEKSRRMQKRRKNLENRQERNIEEKEKLLKNIETVASLKLFPLTHYNDRILTMENVSISYYGNEILDDFNLNIQNSERIALIGKNGSGKSSIMKAILQHTEIDKDNDAMSISGKIETASGLIISYCPQDASFLKGSLENYCRNIDIDDTLFRTILNKLNFNREHFEKNMEEYSSGQKKKVLIAGSLCTRAHLYLWDEPLNYIDIFSRMQIENLILEYKPTMIMVEHDSSFVDKVATKQIVLSN